MKAVTWTKKINHVQERRRMKVNYKISMNYENETVEVMSSY